MRKLLSIFSLCLALAIPVAADLKEDVQTALLEGAAAWNRGDLETFMKGYVQGPELTYTAGGKVVRGSEALFARYQTTYGTKKASMGQLKFDEIEVWPLGPDNALAMGHWLVDFGSPSKPKVQGIFSLVLRKSPEGAWLILHDHTSRLDETKKP